MFPRWPVSRLPRANLTALSSRRVADRNPVRRMLCMVWSNLADGEVLHLQLSVGRIALHGCRDRLAAARIHVSRHRAGACFFAGSRQPTAPEHNCCCMPMAAHLSPVQISFLDSSSGRSGWRGLLFCCLGTLLPLRKRQGMGTGDFALIAMSGAFLGLKLTVVGDFSRRRHRDGLCAEPDGAPCHP